MTQEEKEQLRAKIERKIMTVREDILELREMTKPIGPNNAIGRLSRLDAINNKSVTEASLREAEQRLERLQYNLEQYPTDKFGTCVRCSEPIAIGRLMFMPESIHCMRCAKR